MNKKISIAECLDAIEYLYGQGFIDDMSKDQRWAVEILANRIANDYKLKLE